jgi:hypothetical protein
VQPDKQIQKFERIHQNSILEVNFLGKTPAMGISSINTLLNKIFTRSTDSSFQYTDEFSATSGKTNGFKKLSKHHVREHRGLSKL